MTGGHPDVPGNGLVMKDVMSVFRRVLGHIDLRHQRGRDGFNSSDKIGRERALSELMDGMVGVLRDELWHFSSDVHQCLEIQNYQASNTFDMSVSDPGTSLENRFGDVRSFNSDELNTKRSDILHQGHVLRELSAWQCGQNYLKAVRITDYQRAIDELESQKVGTRVNLLSLNV